MTNPNADFADMGDVIDDFSEPFTIQRRDAGAIDDNGRFAQAPDNVLIDTFGSITPATPNDLQRLPEGRRTDRAMRVLTRTEIKIEPEADSVLWDSIVWEVGHVGPWLGAFYDAVIVKRVQQ